MAEIELRPSVRQFAELMELRLRENDHKGGWDGEDFIHLMGRLVDEWDELRTALVECRAMDAMREAADLGNFAHMVFDVLSRRVPSGYERDELSSISEVIRHSSFAREG